MTKGLRLGVLLALALPGFVHAGQVAQAASPDGRIVLQLELDGEGRLVFRVFDDGVGFRYDVPAQPKLAEAQIVQELTEFAIARPATAWWIPAFEWNREEYLYHRTPLAEVGVGANWDQAH